MKLQGIFVFVYFLFLGGRANVCFDVLTSASSFLNASSSASREHVLISSSLGRVPRGKTPSSLLATELALTMGTNGLGHLRPMDWAFASWNCCVCWASHFDGVVLLGKRLSAALWCEFCSMQPVFRGHLLSDRTVPRNFLIAEFLWWSFV